MGRRQRRVGWITRGLERSFLAKDPFVHWRRHYVERFTAAAKLRNKKAQNVIRLLTQRNPVTGVAGPLYRPPKPIKVTGPPRH